MANPIPSLPSPAPEDTPEGLAPRAHTREPGPGDRAMISPLTLHAFHRHVESLMGRIGEIRPGPASAEVFEALESAMEELRVAVEELRLTSDALLGARAEAEAQRRRYRDLFDLAPDPYLVTDLRGVIREANRAASMALDVEARFLPGKPLVVFLPEEGRPAFRSELARLREATSTQDYELRLKPRRLPPFDAAIRVGIIRDPQGCPSALRWTIRDVSASKRAEEKIRALNARLERRVAERTEQLGSVLQTNERWLIRVHAAEAEAQPEGRLFRDLVEEVDAILWRADAGSGRYTFVSRRAEELLGYPAASWLEDPDFWRARIHPEDRDWAAAHRRKQLDQGADHEAEYRVLAADGRARWFRESVRVLRRDPDRPAELCGLMVNISKRKKVERQLYTAKGELAMQLRDMTYLHELGGRLATARGWRETLDEVLSAVTSLQGTDMALVLIRERGGDRLTLAAGLGLTPEFARLLGRGPLDLGPIGRPLVSREPVVIEETEAGPVDPTVRLAARAGRFRALRGVPLLTRDGEFLGAIVTLFRAPYRAPDGQARLVEMYAEQAAEAIEAARRGGRALGDTATRIQGPLAEILRAARSLTPTDDPAPARGLIEDRARQILDLVADLADGPGPGPPHDANRNHI